MNAYESSCHQSQNREARPGTPADGKQAPLGFPLLGRSSRPQAVNPVYLVGIRRAFVVYLASHNRPVHEVLLPSLRDVRQEYEHDFKEITVEPIGLDALLVARERMVRELQQGLIPEERRFLLSLVAGEPDWSALGIAHLQELPGLR
jgi:hypothetical protein